MKRIDLVAKFLIMLASLVIVCIILSICSGCGKLIVRDLNLHEYRYFPESYSFSAWHRYEKELCDKKR